MAITSIAPVVLIAGTKPKNISIDFVNYPIISTFTLLALLIIVALLTMVIIDIVFQKDTVFFMFNKIEKLYDKFLDLFDKNKTRQKERAKWGK